MVTGLCSDCGAEWIETPASGEGWEDDGAIVVCPECGSLDVTEVAS